MTKNKNMTYKKEKTLAKVSVIITTYNRTHILPRAIQSVLNQTHTNFELIIVDDGSEDNTEQLVKGMFDKRIRYIRHETNKGLPASRNTGIANATAEYIAFLDDDDEWMPRKLELQMKLFDKKNIGMVGCYGLTIYPDHETQEGKNPHGLSREEVSKRSLFECAVAPTSAVVRKIVFDKVGLFYEGFRYGEDSDMWIRILKSFELGFVPEKLFKRYKHGENISMTTSILRKAQFKKDLFEKYKADYLKYPQETSEDTRSIAWRFCMGGDTKEGRAFYRISIRLNPLHAASYLAICVSLFGSSFFTWLYFTKLRILKRLAFFH